MEQINQSQTPRLFKYSKSLRDRRKSIDYRLSKYTFFPEEMKEKMPEAIKRKVMKNSAAANKKGGGILTLHSNLLNIPSSQNDSPENMINGIQTSNPDLKSVFFKNTNVKGISSSFVSDKDKKSDFLKNRFLSGERENEGEKKVLFSDLVTWVINDPNVKKVIKKGKNNSFAV